MKRIVSLTLALLMFISVVPPLNVSASQNENARYGERLVYTVVGTEVVIHTRKVSGQPSEGNTVTNEYGLPGAVIVNPDGGTPFSVSVSVSWGLVSLSITPGSLSGNGSVSGISVPIPNNGRYYHVYGDHFYLIERLYVEEYRGVELISSYYINRVTHTKSKWYIKEVT